MPWWFSARDLFAASDATMLKAPDNQYSGIWTGDDFDRIHPLVQGRKDLFQNKDIVVDKNKYDYIIIGGGMSGLTAAYLLQKKKKRVLLIDQAPEVGGNAKMQKWGEVPYSIGAAYFVGLEEDDPIFSLYKEWGILEKRKKIKDSDNGVRSAGCGFAESFPLTPALSHKWRKWKYWVLITTTPKKGPLKAEGKATLPCGCSIPITMAGVCSLRRYSSLWLAQRKAEQRLPRT